MCFAIVLPSGHNDDRRMKSTVGGVKKKSGRPKRTKNGNKWKNGGRPRKRPDKKNWRRRGKKQPPRLRSVSPPKLGIGVDILGVAHV